MILLVVVTGCAGYIGSICSQLLLEAGYKVIGIDNLSRGFAENIPKGVEFHQGCVGDKEFISKILKSYPVEAVMHFAAYVEVAESMQQPELYKQNNYLNTVSLIETLKANKIDKFIFSSTAAVYGNPESEAITIKEDTRLNPINPYGKYKLAVEKYLATTKDLNYIILRYFNVAGAYKELGECHQPESHLIPLAIDAALGRREIFNLYGTDYQTKDGTAIRDYVHVVDLAKAHIAALKLIGKIPNQAFNLGYGQGFSVLEVVRAIERISRKTIPLNYTNRRPGDPQSLVADSTKAIAAGIFKPQYNSIDRIIEDAYKHRLNYHGI